MITPNDYPLTPFQRVYCYQDFTQSGHIERHVRHRVDTTGVYVHGVPVNTSGITPSIRQLVDYLKRLSIRILYIYV
jgi:hypothetical protein